MFVGSLSMKQKQARNCADLPAAQHTADRVRMATTKANGPSCSAAAIPRDTQAFLNDCPVQTNDIEGRVAHFLQQQRGRSGACWLPGSVIGLLASVLSDQLLGPEGMYRLYE